MILLLLPLCLVLACRQDSGVRLFEMGYPAFRFTIPPGLSAALPRVVEVPDMRTNISFFMNLYNVSDTAFIKSIRPATATITSENNQDFRFVEEVSVRMCPVGTRPCSSGEEVFYIDNLRARAGNQIKLLPTLRNARPQLLQDRVKMEVVFFFNSTTPYEVESRLDMLFEAYDK